MERKLNFRADGGLDWRSAKRSFLNFLKFVEERKSTKTGIARENSSKSSNRIDRNEDILTPENRKKSSPNESSNSHKSKITHNARYAPKN